MEGCALTAQEREMVSRLFLFQDAPAALLDQATHSDFVRDAVCLFFIANEGLSVLENTAVMGVPYPAFVKNMLDALHQTGDQGKGTEART